MSNAHKTTGARPPIFNIVVVGCSGHAKVVLDILERGKRYHVIGLLDDYRAVGTELSGYRVIGRCEQAAELFAHNEIEGAIVAIGDNWTRRQMVAQLKTLVPELSFVSAIHPAAYVAKRVLVGVGTVIAAGAIVNPGAKIGDFCIVNTGASLDHDSRMEDYSSLGPGAVTGGDVQVGAHSVIGIGATISHDVWIGEHTVIGAGSTVVKDIPDHVVAYGSPARIVRPRRPGDPYLGDRGERMRARQKRTSIPNLGSPEIRARLVRPEDPDWSLLLAGKPHDFFHTAAYHRFSEERGEGEAWMAVYSSGGKSMLWPYLLREIAPEGGSGQRRWNDITSTYGYSGPMIGGCAPGDPFVSEAVTAFHQIWRTQDAVSVFTRFHPLLENHKWMEDCETSEFSSLGQTVCIDLAKTETEIWSGYKRQLRQRIRRNAELGMKTEIDTTWKSLGEFVEIYRQTMSRNRAAPFYLFTEEYFLRLKDALGEHGSLVVAKYRDQIAAAVLLVEYGGIATAHLAASNGEFYGLSPSKTAFHEAVCWARNRGNRAFHLGGGRGASDQDPLFLFKSQFSPGSRARWFVVGRWILNSERYHELTACHGKVAADHGFRADPNYFPSYRAPFIGSLA